jgi:hypothetical protein
MASSSDVAHSLGMDVISGAGALLLAILAISLGAIVVAGFYEEFFSEP